MLCGGSETRAINQPFPTAPLCDLERANHQTRKTSRCQAVNAGSLCSGDLKVTTRLILMAAEPTMNGASLLARFNPTKRPALPKGAYHKDRDPKDSSRKQIIGNVYAAKNCAFCKECPCSGNDLSRTTWIFAYLCWQQNQ